MRNKIDPSQHGFWERFLINIPFVLIVAFIVAFIGAGLLFLFYSFVTISAFKSSMIFVLLFGAAIFCVAIGLALIVGFIKYHVFYEKKMDIFKQPEIITTTTQQKKFKDYITLPNISYSLLLIGGLLLIVSGLLGCTNRDNWVNAIEPFMEKNGYYADVQLYNHGYYIQDVNTFDSEVDTIEISFDYKKPVIIYTEEQDKQGYINISTYTSYDRQIESSRSIDKTKVVINDTMPPKIKDSTLNKLLFFIFDDNYFENQVKIFIPLDYKDQITIISNKDVIYAQE